MKSRYFTNQKQASRAAKRVYEEQTNELYYQVAESILRQHTATILYVLHYSFGFGKKRLKRLLNQRNDLCEMMEKKQQIIGKSFDPMDIVNDIEGYLGHSLKPVTISIEEPNTKRIKTKELK